MLNTTLAHYKILRKLGQGGMGDVYLALDEKLGREVALKVLPEELARDAERRGRFEREARAIAALKHPNIVTLYSIEEADGVHFLTLEHVEGETLLGEITEGGMPLDKFFNVSIPLADGLSFAHSKGIAHRDIKPANIMRDESGNLKILDFGLAKLLETDTTSDQTILAAADGVTREGYVMGTVAYMSPEQAEGKAITSSSDVFSLGVVLYELATGRRPFQGDTNISTLSAILKDEPPTVTELRPVVPAHLGRIISRCLAKDPSRRYQSALEVRNELEALRTETDSVLVSQVAAAATSRARSGGIPRPAIWLAAVALLALGAVAVLQLQGRDSGEDSSAAAVSELDGGRRIVVFPFENLGSADDAYFAAGITEEITTRLAGVDDLSVMSRTSAAQYDRTGKTMQQIREDLAVDYVLDGSVRWEKRSEGSNRVRVSPQLIRVADDSQIWASSFDRSMDEIFRVQSEIAEQVVGELNITLAPGDREALEEQLTDNIDAWHAYRRGQAAETGNIDARETWELAVRMYQRAVDLDPGFLRAHAALATAHAAFCHWQIDTSKERLALSKASVDRAFALDPDSPWSFMALGYYHYHGKKEYEPAWQAFQRAQEGLVDDGELYVALGSVRRRQGRFRDALEYFQKAAQAAPRDVYSHINVAETASMVVGDHELGLEAVDKAIALAPDLRVAYMYKCLTYLFMGDAINGRSAIEASPLAAATDNDHVSEFAIRFCLRDFDRALAAASSFTKELVDEQFSVVSRSVSQGLVYRERGQTDLARAAFDAARIALEERVRQRPEDARGHSTLGIAYAGLGRVEDAVRAGKRAVELYPTSVDAYIAPSRVMDLIRIYVLLGDAESALDLMEPRVETPPHSNLSVGWLRLHPFYDDMRDNPRFQALLDRQS